MRVRGPAGLTATPTSTRTAAWQWTAAAGAALYPVVGVLHLVRSSGDAEPAVLLGEALVPVLLGVGLTMLAARLVRPPWPRWRYPVSVGLVSCGLYGLVFVAGSPEDGLRTGGATDADRRAATPVVREPAPRRVDYWVRLRTARDAAYDDLLVDRFRGPEADGKFDDTVIRVSDYVAPNGAALVVVDLTSLEGDIDAGKPRELVVRETFSGAALAEEFELLDAGEPGVAFGCVHDGSLGSDQSFCVWGDDCCLTVIRLQAPGVTDEAAVEAVLDFRRRLPGIASRPAQ